MSNKKTIYNKDDANKKLFVVREFDAPLDQVWKAWTDSSILDKWWAPKPWKAKTKKMEFREGGSWLYSMVGPDGSEHWSRSDYKTIIPNKSYTEFHAFADSNGNVISDMGSSIWNVSFSSTQTGTKVEVEITFPSEDVMTKFLAMGFEGGFAMGHANLDELLEKEAVGS